MIIWQWLLYHSSYWAFFCSFRAITLLWIWFPEYKFSKKSGRSGYQKIEIGTGYQKNWYRVPKLVPGTKFGTRCALHPKSGKICPFQKYCPNGCPCNDYVCEKIGDKDQQELPVWDLESKTSDYNKKGVNLDLNIFQRRKELNREPKTSGFRISLYDLSSTNSASQVYVEADVLYPYEWIDLFHFWCNEIPRKSKK